MRCPCRRPRRIINTLIQSSHHILVLLSPRPSTARHAVVQALVEAVFAAVNTMNHTAQHTGALLNLGAYAITDCITW